MGGFFHTICDYIAPKRCIGCGTMDTWMCSSCIQKNLAIQHIPFDQAVTQALHIHSLTTIGAYGNPFWRKAITQLKFQYTVEMAPLLSLLLRETLLRHTTILQHAAQHHRKICVLPLPAHPKRLRERGFNQTELIARSFHLPPHCVLYPHALQKIRYTHSQTHFDYTTRFTNIAGTIGINQNMVLQELRSSIIILIDDVITTGATIREAAQALSTVQPSEIHALAIARG